jgi:hypothetical protein
VRRKFRVPGLGTVSRTPTGHENKDLLSEAINSFRLFDILKLFTSHGKLFQKGK